MQKQPVFWLAIALTCALAACGSTYATHQPAAPATISATAAAPQPVTTEPITTIVPPPATPPPGNTPVATVSVGGTGTGGPVATANPPLTAVPISTASPPATPIPPTGGGTVTPSAVTITTNSAHFASGVAVQFTIVNGLTAAISAADHQSNCTVVTLQQQTTSGWTSVARCPLMSPTRLIELAASSTTPGSLGTGAMTAATGWAAGTYRLQFSYMPGPETTPGTPVIIYSEPFTIG